MRKITKFDKNDWVKWKPITVTIATQIAPITKALEDSPKARRILDRVMPLVREGVGLAREISAMTRKGR